MRVAISQRVERVAAYGEERDCLDQQWVRLLVALGLTPLAVPNALDNVNQWLADLEVEAIILSGGNDLAQLPGANNAAPRRDATEMALLDYAQHRQLPLLGVCRGLQMLNVWAGGKLTPVTGHTATRHALVAADPATAGQMPAEVNSYHNWGIAQADLAPALRPLYFSPDGYVEAARHKTLPWLGLMWHPEREQPFCAQDRQLIESLFRGNS